MTALYASVQLDVKPMPNFFILGISSASDRDSKGPSEVIERTNLKIELGKTMGIEHEQTVKLLILPYSKADIRAMALALTRCLPLYMVQTADGKVNGYLESNYKFYAGRSYLLIAYQGDLIISDGHLWLDSKYVETFLSSGIEVRLIKDRRDDITRPAYLARSPIVPDDPSTRKMIDAIYNRPPVVFPTLKSPELCVTRENLRRSTESLVASMGTSRLSLWVFRNSCSPGL